MNINNYSVEELYQLHADCQTEIDEIYERINYITSFNTTDEEYIELQSELERLGKELKIVLDRQESAYLLAELYSKYDNLYENYKDYASIADGLSNNDNVLLDEMSAKVEKQLEEYDQKLADILLSRDNYEVGSNQYNILTKQYEELEYDKTNDCSLLSVNLETGRHHQIRVQFSSRGHTLLGDQRYGKLDYTQIALFCYYLSFPHPITKEYLTFSLAIPNEGYWTKFTV